VFETINVVFITRQLMRSGAVWSRFLCFRYSFICQGTSTKTQRSDLFGLRVKLPPVTTSLTIQR